MRKKKSGALFFQVTKKGCWLTVKFYLSIELPLLFIIYQQVRLSVVFHDRALARRLRNGRSSRGINFSTTF